MKKFLLIVLTLAMLVSCSEKNTEDTAVYETEETTQEEWQFKELSQEDFKSVTLNMAMSESTPPLEIHSFDILTFDFGEKMSPCKEYKNSNFKEEYGDPEIQKAYEDYIDEICSEPASGMITGATVGGGKIFIEVNYDNYDWQHCCSIFSYDLETEKLKELVEFSSAEGDFYDFMYYVNDRLILTNTVVTMPMYDEEERQYDTSIYEVNTENGGYTKIGGGNYGYGSVLDGKLVFYDYYNEGDELIYRVFEFDFDTCEFVKVYEGDPDTFWYRQEYNGESLTDAIHENEDRTVTINTPDYSIKTDIKYNDVVFTNLSEDIVSVITNQSFSYTNNRTLYIYNLKTMECCVSDINGYGQNFNAVGKNIVATSVLYGESVFNPVYLIIPEIGTAYKIFESNSYSYNLTDGNFVMIKDLPQHYYFNYYNMEQNQNRQTEIYWFEID